MANDYMANDEKQTITKHDKPRGNNRHCKKETVTHMTNNDNMTNMQHTNRNNT